MKYYFAIAAFLIIIGFAFYVEIVTWQECLSKNSFFYCMRIMSK